MKANVRIERVVLDGLKLSRWERDALGPAIAEELRRLADQRASGAGARTDFQYQEPGSAVGGIAREIAAAVHRATAAARPAAGPAARGRRR
jgi:hypothetical protein